MVLFSRSDRSECWLNGSRPLKRSKLTSLQQTTVILINLRQAPRDDSTRICTCRTSYVRRRNCGNDQLPLRTLLSKEEYENKDPERGRNWLGGGGKSKWARKWREYFSMRYFFHPFRLSLAPKSVACVAWRFLLGALK